ncbi:DNA or RNA helicases of superfamily II [Legionella oakridgensis ATCC 33761 = DSM 21215]|uniref:DNA or RNA helicases of superfamily II n=1 Tax=Legionella oakridgensis ATCC 33761 = DSM 21215 TaxID=1268635 RepID=W0BB38_9GAMM|nr:DEAD/DEAH box helicase family protein [Legionella oakridgensis]AHE65817.1 DNA or RNA helicases of superfamily II [Legionella oakridgensis ATCC 33761 = DSM 21215]
MSKEKIQKEFALSHCRLKYANGETVPPEVETYQKDRLWFAKDKDGQEIKVFTTSALSGRRLKYANGEAVPPEVETYQSGRQWFAKNEDGQEIEVFTANALGHRRLKYANGETVPPEVETYQRGRQWFAKNEDGQEIKVFTTSVLYHHLLKYAKRQPASGVAQAAIESEEDVLEEEEVLFSKQPMAGISEKYLRNKIPRLPISVRSSRIDESVWGSFSSQLGLIPLENTRGVVSSLLNEVPHLFHEEGLRIGLCLYTSKPFSSGDKPLFVFSGRKEKAYIPQIGNRTTSDVRVILVGTREEFGLLQGHLQPGIDFLVLDELWSLTHGSYEKLELVNSRRIAAFYYALLLQEEHGITQALMLDDNIERIYSKHPISSWEEYITILDTEAKSEKSACVSLATVSNQGVRRQQPGELGSKFYSFDLALLYEILGHTRSHWLLPFFPAEANGFWGEDYYFQLMFEKLLSTRGMQGYFVLDVKEHGIKRASLPSLCRKVVKTADALCQVNMEGLFQEGLMHLLSVHRDAIEKTVHILQGIIEKNIKLHQTLLHHHQTKDLMMTHAWANRLAYKAEVSQVPIDEETFLAKLRESLIFIQEQGHLHEYQKEILTNISTRLSQERFIGQITMATGTGKTYVQIYLAIAALLAGTRRPVVIVTPYQHLVQQAYEDFLAVLASFPNFPIEASQIVKVDAKETSITAETLLYNRTLDGRPCVLIFCQDSYSKLQETEAEALAPYQHPALLLIDEAHMQSKIISKIDITHPQTKQTFVAGFTATPKKSQALWSLDKVVSIEYTREAAVDHDYLTPCILDTFNEAYSPDGVWRVISAMPTILDSLLPSGGPLKEKKALFMCPITKEKSIIQNN